MGTRADFYIQKRNGKMEWLGSIAWDGFPSKMPMFFNSNQKEFRKEVNEFLKKRDDATFPKDGWPWPWKNSKTTDYAYVYSNGVVYGSNYGGQLFNLEEYSHLASLIDSLDHLERNSDIIGNIAETANIFDTLKSKLEKTFVKKKVKWPEMDKEKMATPGSKRSGVLVFG